MSYFANILGGPGAAKPKKFKPEEVPLYENRLQIDPGTNVQRIGNMVPWWNAVNNAASNVTQRMQQTDSPLIGQLTADASSDLALGGELDPWQTRQAVQGAREAWTARGLGNSAPASFAEVLNRIQFSDARRQQRRQNAMGVAGLGLQQRQQNTQDLSALTSTALAPYGMAEGMRQFDLERDDTLRFNDKNIAKDLKVGEQNAAASRSAGRQGMFGSILGGILGGI